MIFISTKNAENIRESIDTIEDTDEILNKKKVST